MHFLRRILYTTRATGETEHASVAERPDPHERNGNFAPTPPHTPPPSAQYGVFYSEGQTTEGKKNPTWEDPKDVARERKSCLMS